MWPFTRKRPNTSPEPHWAERAFRRRVETPASCGTVRYVDDAQAEAAVRRRRRKLLLSVMEVTLGDLVAMDGLERTRDYIREFERQLTEY